MKYGLESLGERRMKAECNLSFTYTPNPRRLWCVCARWKDRYYVSKFKEEGMQEGFRTRIAHEYIRGLCWVLLYYYQGVASWNWYGHHLG